MRKSATDRMNDYDAVMMGVLEPILVPSVMAVIAFLVPLSWKGDGAVPNPEYYHRQADLCLRMALLTSEYEERLRLLDIANGYRDDAVRVEALQGASRSEE